MRLQICPSCHISLSTVMMLLACKIKYQGTAPAFPYSLPRVLPCQGRFLTESKLLLSSACGSFSNHCPAHQLSTLSITLSMLTRLLPVATCIYRLLKMGLLVRWICRSRALAFPEPKQDANGGAPATRMTEGLIPGLDFCNHCRGAPCRWTVLGGPVSSHAKSQE